MADLKERRETRISNRQGGRDNGESGYFQKGEGGKEVELRDTFTFSMGFVFAIFMAGLVGYCLGAYYFRFGWK